MTLEENKNYNTALKRAKAILNVAENQKEVQNCIMTIFPELKEEYEDEKIRKELIDFFQDWHKIKPSRLSVNVSDILAWLEKQGRQEQLYIRFGEIPTDEKSKIYRGEVEVGTENGVSVYPAFKTSEGDIVLGLNLPITKTTLYTQQHLIEYDDRPCYLVKGDYIGKDTDGQPLINNVSIIEKIDTYRVKEKKQDEQKSIIEMKSPEESLCISSKEYNDIVNDCIYGKQKSTFAYCAEHCKGFQETGKCFADGDCKAKIEADQKSTIWSEEDEKFFNDTIAFLKDTKNALDHVDWIKSLKQRIISKL